MCPFLELAKLVGATAETILQYLLEVVDARHLPVEKLFGIATDSATGIATCIKRKNPFVFFYALHCSQGINGYSPKHSNTLEHLQAILDCAESKFQQIFHTRWLSFDGAVQAVLNNLEPLMSALISDSSTDPTT